MIFKQKKSVFCWNCMRYTPHTYVGRETMMDGAGPLRIVMAICSAGISEISIRRNWQCDKCGDINSSG